MCGHRHLQSHVGASHRQGIKEITLGDDALSQNRMISVVAKSVDVQNALIQCVYKSQLRAPAQVCCAWTHQQRAVRAVLCYSCSVRNLSRRACSMSCLASVLVALLQSVAQRRFYIATARIQHCMIFPQHTPVATTFICTTKPHASTWRPLWLAASSSAITLGRSQCAPQLRPSRAAAAQDEAAVQTEVHTRGQR